MSRFLPLLIFVIWLSSPAVPALAGIQPLPACAFFSASKSPSSPSCPPGAGMSPAPPISAISRNACEDSIWSSTPAEFSSPPGLASVSSLLGWKAVIVNLLDKTPIGNLPIEIPGLFLGCLPSFLAWMGMWWAQFPADRALREQNILIQLNENLPLQPPPSFRTYFFVNLRFQLLFTLAPALLLLVLHDALSLILPPIFDHIPLLAHRQEIGESLITLPALAIFLIFSPEILRRVLDTEPLPDCPLRRRLVEIARRHGVRFSRCPPLENPEPDGQRRRHGFRPSLPLRPAERSFAGNDAR